MVEFPSLVPPVLEGASDVILGLIVATVVLTGFSLLFAGIALGLHFWTRRQKQGQEARHRNWQAGLFRVLAGELPPGDLPARVAPAHRAEFLSFLVPYATTVQGEAYQQIQSVAHPFLETLQGKLSSSRPLIRALAVQRLGLLGGEAYADALRARLNDPDPQVALMSARRLTKLSNPDDATLIIEQLDRFEQVDRRQVTSILVDLGDEATSAYRSALDDPSRGSFTRVCCAEALRWLGDTEASSVSDRLLCNQDPYASPEDPELTAALLRLLRRVGQDRHADVVRSYLASPVSFVRIHAARALGQLGGGQDLQTLTTLVRGDDSRWVALSAARSLAELGYLRPLRQLRDSTHPRASLATDILPTAA